jgi:hypothetical protein
VVLKIDRELEAAELLRPKSRSLLPSQQRRKEQLMRSSLLPKSSITMWWDAFALFLKVGNR